MYQVIYRSPDNSDGIYHDGHLVVSAHTLHRHGYELYQVLHWRQEALARLVRELA